MKSKNIRLLCFMLVGILLIAINGCSRVKQQTSSKKHGDIYLYGEYHGVKEILDQEFDLWYDYYHNQGMRHLFIEDPYYTAEFLNLWMKAEDDTILEQLFIDWIGTAANTSYYKEFYQKIKKECPETIFHGTDVGHQYDSTGKRFLEYLKEEGKESSEQYALAEEAIEQGKYYYNHDDNVYRENKMAENFIREFDKLKNQNIMGIYGAAHTDLESMDYYTLSIPCMGNQLKERYGESVFSKELSSVGDVEPERVDTIELAGKEYQASYFGIKDITGKVEGFTQLKFWRIENAYDDFEHESYIRDSLPSYNYPTAIKIGDVWLVEATKTDGSILKLYYRCDKNIWITKGFRIDET